MPGNYHSHVIIQFLVRAGASCNNWTLIKETTPGCIVRLNRSFQEPIASVKTTERIMRDKGPRVSAAELKIGEHEWASLPRSIPIERGRDGFRALVSGIDRHPSPSHWLFRRNENSWAFVPKRAWNDLSLHLQPSLFEGPFKFQGGNFRKKWSYHFDFRRER